MSRTSAIDAYTNYRSGIMESLIKKLAIQGRNDAGKVFEDYYQAVADNFGHEPNAEEFADHILWVDKMVKREPEHDDIHIPLRKRDVAFTDVVHIEMDQALAKSLYYIIQAEFGKASDSMHQNSLKFSGIVNDPKTIVKPFEMAQAYNALMDDMKRYADLGNIMESIKNALKEG